MTLKKFVKKYIDSFCNICLWQSINGQTKYKNILIDNFGIEYIKACEILEDTAFKKLTKYKVVLLDSMYFDFNNHNDFKPIDIIVEP